MTALQAAGTSSGQQGLALPRILHGSRREELERVFEAARRTAASCLDASGVTSLDSAGLDALVSGLARLRRQGCPLPLQRPSAPLRAARRALRLQDRVPFCSEDEEPPEPELGQRLGEVLVALGFLTRARLEEAVRAAEQEHGAHLGTFLVQRGYVDETQLARALARQYGMPYVEPVAQQILDLALENKVPLAQLRAHGALPFLRLDDVLAVAVRDPSDVYGLDAVRHHSGRAVLASVSTATEIARGLDLLQRSAAGQSEIALAGGDAGLNVDERFHDMLLNALIEGASDLHLEPLESGLLLRYRVDGLLRRVGMLNPDEGTALTAHIKVRAGCDISEKRLPQDGRIHFTHAERDVDLRVSTLPTMYGEKTVMRILDRKASHLSLEQLGLQGQNLQWLRDAIHAPHGMVLVTGPTGSGKTTTLYSVLDEVVTPEINVSTVENPVERAVEGVNQTQVNHKAGLTFALCLRALLRQDPDVIMIGEIRDLETAEIAVEAALTGHLVLATLHTNDAPGAATRLIQMGIPPFLVAATLRAVMAQRLVRRLCEVCKQPVQLPPEVRGPYERYGLGQGPAYKAAGCPACRQQGYDRRFGVYEVMRVDEAMQDLIARNPSSVEVRAQAVRGGMVELLADAIGRVNRGETTLEEAICAGGAAA